MKRMLCRVLCCLVILLVGQAPARADGAVRFTPPIEMAFPSAELPRDAVYAARSADGRWAMVVARSPLAEDDPAPLETLAARYRGTPGVTAGAPYRQHGVEFLPLWEHRPEGDAPFTLHMVACVLDGALYRFILIDQAAAGPEETYPARAFAALDICITKEAIP